MNIYNNIKDSCVCVCKGGLLVCVIICSKYCVNC